MTPPSDNMTIVKSANPIELDSFDINNPFGLSDDDDDLSSISSVPSLAEDELEESVLRELNGLESSLKRGMFAFIVYFLASC